MTYEETFGETVFAVPPSTANDWFYTPFRLLGSDCDHYFSDVFAGRFYWALFALGSERLIP